jgi:peroxidase
MNEFVGSRAQFNLMTATIDANTVYGVRETFARSLRSGYGGQMRWDGYDPTVNTGILASFAAAAFRFGHTLLPTNVERWSKQHRYITHTPLSDLIRQPFDLYEPGVFDEYFLGMTNQPALALDDFVTAEVTTMLFRKIGERHGVDLTAFNLQRNREVGLPGYTIFHKFCGHSPINTWEDLLGSMSNDRFASVLRCDSLPFITI